MRGGERAWVTFWHFKSFAAGTVSVGRCIFHRHWVDMWPHAGGRERPPSCRAGPSFRTLSAPEAGGLSACLGHVCEKPDANSSFTSIRRFFLPSKTINVQSFRVRKQDPETAAPGDVFSRPGLAPARGSKPQEGGTAQTGPISDLPVILTADPIGRAWGSSHTGNQLGKGREAVNKNPRRIPSSL